MIPTLNDIREALQCDKPGCACRRGGARVVHCPAHDDREPSLSIKEEGSKLLIHCFAGCAQDAVVAALRERGLWPKPKRTRVRIGVNGAALTLQELAQAKRLPVEFLQQLSVKDTPHGVRIPYRDDSGQTIAARYRIALTGDRFRWRSGDKAMLYGLDRLAAIRDAGWVLLVEGESDAWACWYHNLPALGIPGKATWRQEWTRYLAGLQAYAWIEPHAEDFAERLGRDLPGLRLIFAQQTGYKDISDAHCAGEDVPALLERLKAQAPTFAEWRAQRLAQAASALEERARPVLEHPDPLVLVQQAIRSAGWGGDDRPVLKGYIAATTRLLEHRLGALPCHVAFTGPASGGKSTAAHIVQALLPESAYVVLPASSPRVIVYHEADYHHRMLLVEEIDSLPTATTDEDNPIASAIRGLLQDGELSYDVTERDESGRFTVRHIRKPGPTMLMVTATRLPASYSQFATRILEIAVPDDRQQIAEAVRAIGQAELAEEPWRPDPALVAFQAVLQARAPWRVVIPFAPAIAEHLACQPLEPRATRDLRKLYSLVKAVAVLRHQRRATDPHGRLVATIEDYATIYELFWEDYAAATGASESVRQVVEAVAALRPETKGRLTIAAVARQVELPRATVYRAVERALEAGWLLNAAKRGYDLAPGEALPTETGLPRPTTLAAFGTEVTEWIEI
jgi:hypothetical protein